VKSFTVNSKDLFDREKNPKLSLSVKSVLKNPKIPKQCPECSKLGVQMVETSKKLICPRCNYQVEK